MLNVGEQMALRHAVAPQLVGHDHPRHLLQTLQQAPEEALGGFGISAFLNENVEHNAVLIHGAPKIMLHALDPNEHLVQVPLAPPVVAVGGTGGWRNSVAEFLATAPNSYETTIPRSARSI
jgi:hypothetical protein